MLARVGIFWSWPLWRPDRSSWICGGARQHGQDAEVGRTVLPFRSYWTGMRGIQCTPDIRSRFSHSARCKKRFVAQRVRMDRAAPDAYSTVSYTHLTLPTNRE